MELLCMHGTSYFPLFSALWVQFEAPQTYVSDFLGGAINFVIKSVSPSFSFSLKERPDIRSGLGDVTLARIDTDPNTDYHNHRN